MAASSALRSVLTVRGFLSTRTAPRERAKRSVRSSSAPVITSTGIRAVRPRRAVSTSSPLNHGIITSVMMAS